MIAQAWMTTPIPTNHHHRGYGFAFSTSSLFRGRRLSMAKEIREASSSSSSSVSDESTTTMTTTTVTTLQKQEQQQQQPMYDYTVPEDAVVHIKPAAMRRLRELRAQQKLSDNDDLILRMGVRSGGCSGMSYVMDFCSADSIHPEDDQVDVYVEDRIQCVVDAKSMLYLFGLELDYSTELIGGGFQFMNPNAEESCGCGSSFAV